MYALQIENLLRAQGSGNNMQSFYVFIDIVMRNDLTILFLVRLVFASPKERSKNSLPAQRNITLMNV
jgi:hypothetical protein